MKIYEIEKVGLGLTIFDIDDTLFHTTAQISVMKGGKVVRKLSNQEFNVYTLQPGESFDFGEFRNAEKFNKESVPIGPMIAKLKAILKNAGDSTVIMLTARSDFDNKELFLDTFKKYGIDMSKIHVHRSGNLGLPSAEGKAVWIRRYLDTGKYGRVRLYDDAMSNLKMLIGLKQEYPNVQFFPYFVTPEGSIRTVKEVTNPPEVAESRLNEVFDQPYPWTWTLGGKNKGLWVAEFNDVDVSINLSDAGLWEMAFGRNGSQEVTGEGDQFKIFSTVIDIAKDFIKLNSPRVLKFSAEKEDLNTKSTSRTKLYSAMVRRFASGLGYDFREQSPYSDYTDYILTRKQNVKEAKITELFDDIYPYQIGMQTRWFTVYEFGDDISVTIEKLEDGDDYYVLSFDKDGEEGATGEGDQFKVFGTVMAIAKDFINRNAPTTFKFSAEKVDRNTGATGRPRLYSRLSKTLARQSGYDVVEKSNGRYMDYILTRKQERAVTEDGKIVPGVNTTVDVKPGETERQAAKFGNKLTKSGPPLLMAAATKNSTPNKLFNVGLAEKRYTTKEWAILEGGHTLEDQAPRKWFKI